MKGNHRVLTDRQVEEAKRLREQEGYTKDALAELFEVAPTTMWYNIYGRKRKTNRVYFYRKDKEIYKYVDIHGFVSIVAQLREKGLTSGQVALVFNVPIEQVNKIWCKTL